MEQFYVFIIRNDIWIVIIASLALFWYVTELIRSQRILRRAVFGLERERGTHIRNNALMFIVGLTAVISGIYYVNNNIAPQLPPEIFREPTPTPDPFKTPLASPTPLSTPIPSPTPPLVPTITLPGGANTTDNEPGTAEATAGVETPSPTITPIVACIVQLNISEPQDGAVVAGTISFNGSANIDNFQFYKLEANGPQTNGQWASLLGRTVDQPVENGFLGSANLSQWESGPYLIRLTAVDTSANEVAHCVIQITLEN